MDQRIECMKLAVALALQQGGDPIEYAQRFWNFVSGADFLKDYVKSAGYPVDNGEAIKATAN